MPHRLCLYYDIGDEFWDASPRATDGEEFFEQYGRNVGPTGYPAQRRLARIRDESTGEIVWGWRPLGGWPPLPGDPDPTDHLEAGYGDWLSAAQAWRLDR